jgi:hypothetical protein
MVATCEYASSALPATCSQSVGKRGAQGNPSNPNSTFPRATTLGDLGAGSVSPTVAFSDGLESGPLEDPKVKVAQPDAPQTETSPHFPDRC